MIIERIIEQIKAANWTVVVIELLVVFVGVYGAFQLVLFSGGLCFLA